MSIIFTAAAIPFSNSSSPASPILEKSPDFMTSLIASPVAAIVCCLTLDSCCKAVCLILSTLACCATICFCVSLSPDTNS